MVWCSAPFSVNNGVFFAYPAEICSCLAFHGVNCPLPTFFYNLIPKAFSSGHSILTLEGLESPISNADADKVLPIERLLFSWKTCPIEWEILYTFAE